MTITSHQCKYITQLLNFLIILFVFACNAKSFAIAIILFLLLCNVFGRTGKSNFQIFVQLLL